MPLSQDALNQTPKRSGGAMIRAIGAGRFGAPCLVPRLLSGASRLAYCWAEVRNLMKHERGMAVNFSVMKRAKTLVAGAIGFIVVVSSASGSGLGSLVLEGQELHASLKMRQLDDTIRHVRLTPSWSGYYRSGDATEYHWQ